MTLFGAWRHGLRSHLPAFRPDPSPSFLLRAASFPARWLSRLSGSPGALPTRPGSAVARLRRGPLAALLALPLLAVGAAGEAQAQSVLSLIPSGSQTVTEGNSGHTDRWFFVNLSSSLPAEFSFRVCVHADSTATRNTDATVTAREDFDLRNGSSHLIVPVVTRGS